MPVEIDRRTFLALTAMTGLEVGTRKVAAAGAAKRPNMLIFMADQHSARFLRCYGNDVMRTPNLDRLAKRGVLFEHTYCQAPLCVPSRTSFLTGRQPSQSRVWNNDDCMWFPSGEPTFAHALGAAGYRTTLIGRMHLCGVDQWHGFDTRLIGDAENSYTGLQVVLPKGKGFLAGTTGKSLTVAGPGETAYRAFDSAVTKTAIDYLQGIKDSDQPFCIVVGFVSPHSPYICSPEDWEYYRDRVELPTVPAGYYDTLNPVVREWLKWRGFLGTSPAEAKRALAAYCGLVSEVDRNVGSILNALDRTSFAEDTCVIYTSDHGEMAGEHGMWGKFCFYEGSVTVPLLMSQPSRLPQGKRVSQVVALADVAPTLCDMAGTEAMPGAAGSSLMPLVGGSQARWSNRAFSELPQIGPTPATRMIRQDQWKLVNYDGAQPQLFNLEEDPQEFRDLGGDPAHAAIRDKLLGASVDGWFPEEIRKTLEYRAEAQKLIKRWDRATHPPTPFTWHAPAGSNVFPK